MESSARRGIALLYVEDEANAREMVARMLALKYPELTLYVAEDGAQGVAIFREHRPDIVITDILMPVMDGIQMSREIKAIDPDAIIIATTAYSDTSYLMNAIEIGIQHYVMKPLNYQNLFQAVEKKCQEIALRRLVGEQAQSLAVSERMFSQVFQATPELLCITARDDGSFLEVNEAFLRTLGYQRDEVIGRRTEDLEGYLESEQYQRVLAWAREHGQLRDLEVQIRKKGGEPLTGLLSAEEMEIDGRPSLLLLFKDMSEQRRMEEERARLAAIVESTDDAIMATDPYGIITSWNLAAQKIFGYNSDEMKGQHLVVLAAPERREEMSALLEKVRAGEPVTQFETLQECKDGRQIRVSFTLSPLMDSQGRMVGASGIARDVTMRSQMEESIRHQAKYDTLTDLPNRQLFMDFLALELAQARRNRKKLAVLFLDLDRFKQINDTLGHAAGDQLLVEVAQRLKACVRESDTVARIGGDEFNVLMPDLNQTDDVGVVVRKIVSVFEKPFRYENLTIDTAISIGISVFPDDGDNGADLVQKADTAMYVAKESSSNAYQFYNSEINNRIVQRQQMEFLLRQAVHREEMELHYQPQVRTDTGEILGVEALLRWRQPGYGLLLPGQFLAVAEETGAIVPIGEWAIRKACHQMKQWQEQGLSCLLTVNLSTRQFHQPNLVEVISEALHDTGLEPKFLELDITEDTIMNLAGSSMGNLHKLTDLGVTLSIDDFGIGASSLQCLKALPVARVKIDRSFIRQIPTEPDDLAVVNAVIAMAHNLRMRVHAVGVESRRQLRVIRKNGCDGAQGDLISRPLPPKELEKKMLVHG